MLLRRANVVKEIEGGSEGRQEHQPKEVLVESTAGPLLLQARAVWGPL